MPAIGAILAWFAGLAGQLVTWFIGMGLSYVAAFQLAEIVMRLLRVAAGLALVTALVNLAIPDGAPLGLHALWADVLTEAYPFLDNIGYFVPVGFLFSLVDIYIAFVLVMIAVNVGRRLMEASQ